MRKPNYEASADARSLARVVYDYYAALVLEGFSEKQALILVGQMLINSTGKG